MTRPPNRIHLDPPTTESQRLQIKQRVFSELALAPVPMQLVEQPTPRWRIGIAFAGAIAATAVITWLVVRDDRPRAAAQQPTSPQSPAEPAPEMPPDAAPPPAKNRTHIAVPDGQDRRLEIDDAVVEARSRTVADVYRADDGGTRVSLSMGTIRCSVPPRPNRPQFEVEAGDVRVIVRGTLFSVQRDGDDVHVHVERGKVVVESDSADAVVRAGQRWSSAPETASTASPAPAPKRRAQPRATPEMYEQAQSLEAKSPARAANAYRNLAAGRGRWAALALYSLAELEHRRRNYRAALAAIQQHQRRFRRSRHADDVAWLRVEVLEASGRSGAARAAARDYVERFPTGTYAGLARRLAGDGSKR